MRRPARCRSATSSASAVLPASDAGVADVLGAASVVVSEAAVNALGGITGEPSNGKVEKAA